MILTGSSIKKFIENGSIIISPYDEKNVNPNSYDVTLSNIIYTYDNKTLDMKKENTGTKNYISESGFLLEPNQLYIGSTNESTVSKDYVPMLEGRSSIGRLGINIHITAGFGDLGWGFKEDETCTYPTWTLEISVVKPVIVYPNVRIGQVYFVIPFGEPNIRYKGKYQEQKEPTLSKLYKDF